MTKKMKWWELPKDHWRNNRDRGRDRRDSQRQKVYDAELALEVHSSNSKFNNLYEIQAFLDKLIRSAWFRRRWDSPTFVHVMNGPTGGFTADARKADNRIRIGLHGKNMVTALHELAHLVKPTRAGAPHGRYFCKAFLELTQHIMGKRAMEILREGFKDHKVKYLPRRNVSEEARTAASERFKQMHRRNAQDK